MGADRSPAMQRNPFCGAGSCFLDASWAHRNGQGVNRSANSFRLTANGVEPSAV